MLIGGAIMEITANAIQTIAQGQNVIFTDTVVPGNPAIMHRPGSGLVKLRGLTSCQCRARFKVFFSANIAIPEDGDAPDAIVLAITIDGEPIAVTRMGAVPADVNNYFNVSTETYVDVPAKCCSTIGVVNAEATTMNVANANLIVERVA